jgi:hypothetical protein
MAKSPLVTYGLESEIPSVVNWNQYTIELKSIGRNGTTDLGGVSREEHFHRFIQLAYPWVWKYWNDWLEQTCWAWNNYSEIGATGCGGAGKTFSFALMAWVEWNASPLKSACVLTSTTSTALRTKLWPRVKDLFNKFNHNGTIARCPFHLVDSQTKIEPNKGDDEHAVRAVAVEGGELSRAIGSIQGRHPERMIIVVDEGEQTEEAIFFARTNMRIGTRLFKFSALANAINPFSAYGQFIAPKNGWPSVSEYDEMWETKTGICLHFHGRKSPNVKAGKIVVPGLITQQDIDDTIQHHGANSLHYWVYIAGFPAPTGVRNTVLDASLIFTGNAQEKAKWTGGYEMWAALDPAFTTGGDECILRFARVGNFDDQLPGIELLPPVQIKFTEDREYPANYQIADRVREELLNYKCDASNLSMDATSASGLCDIMSQRIIEGYNIMRVQFGGKPPDTPVSMTDKRRRCDVYKDKVTDLWFCAREVITNGRMRGLDSETAEELCMRQFELQGEKSVVESKKDMKKRTGGKSPDRADPTCILCSRFITEYGATGGSSKIEADATKEWQSAIKRYNLHGKPSSYATP